MVKALFVEALSSDRQVNMIVLLILVAAVAAEECNSVCHANWDPVCGSDGK